MHGVDVEGKKCGIEEALVVLLGESCPLPVTYGELIMGDNYYDDKNDELIMIILDDRKIAMVIIFIDSDFLSFFCP